MIKKADIILGLSILIVGLSSWFYIDAMGVGKGDIVKITVDGKLYGTYDINQDRIVTIHRSPYINKINIKDGTVAMKFSNCRGQDCVKMGKKHIANDYIVCLPNKVMIEIEGEDGKLDAISK